MSIVYIIIAIVMFGVLIAVHELGHFMAAKACNVKVEEFSVGMGPAILKKQSGETLYALRCIPIGGYCAMTGEDGNSDDPRAFVNQAGWKRVIILAAGAAMNLLLGFVIVLILFMGAKAFTAPVIADFMEGCPLEHDGGMQVGDRFYRIDGKRVYQYSDVGDLLSEGDGIYDLVLIRDGKKVRLNDFQMTKQLFPGQEKEMYGFYFGYDEATVLTKLRYSWDQCMEFSRWVWTGLKQMLSGQVSRDDISGPVGIVDMMAETGENAETAADAIYSILYITAFIAVNLAIMNMLPIPALDGGRVFLLLVTAVIEALTRKKLDPKYEAYIHAAGMVLLLALMGFVMFNDIVRIVKR